MYLLNPSWENPGIKLLFLTILLYSPLSSAKPGKFSCGASDGYAMYFDNGLIPEDTINIFRKDGISNGRTTLISDGEGGGDVLFYDVNEEIKSATSQGGKVIVMAGENHINWLVFYPEGTITIDSLHNSMKLTSYRNATGNGVLPKVHLFKSECNPQ
tara:strand:- start:50 stop:520 length:471 start_codon:yes stop_codon:yes gene_type:complete